MRKGRKSGGLKLWVTTGLKLYSPTAASKAALHASTYALWSPTISSAPQS
jgi:hypothetical protein